MGSETVVTSLQNPRVKEVVRLRDRRQRDESGLFLIEGYRELLRASQAGWLIDTLFICRELFLGSNEGALINTLKESGARAVFCSSEVFKKISYRDRPDGLLAIAPQKHRTLDDLQDLLKNKSAPFLVVAESIEKPGNLGTILRSSDAVGLDALIVCDQCTDVFNPNVVRASVGTLFKVPVIATTSQSLIRWLKQHRIAILAATPSASQEFTAVDMKQPLAIALGTEQLGLSDAWMQQADLQVSIPMKGAADSLNVAMAATLLLYEVLRQRSL